MFTGIVEEAGEVTSVDDEGRRIRVRCSFADELSQGQSVAVDGVCLTVEDHTAEEFEVFVSDESLEKTSFDAVAAGDIVNLERALPADGRFDGHVVQGHVDTTTEVSRVEEDEGGWTYWFQIPKGFESYVAEKGSVAVDGVSLTVASVDDGEFSVAVIPETRRATNFTMLGAGDHVNFEADVLAKYVESTAESYLDS